ncbi:MAG: hypothetical protein R3Y21_01360 [Mycoplasmatota bacterium]
MEEEIFKLIYDCSKRNVILGKNELMKLVDIVIRYKSLDDYVKDVLWDEDILDSFSFIASSGYDTTYKQIYFLLDNIVLAIANHVEIFTSFEPGQRIFTSNVFIAQLALHELEHAMQHKIVDINADTFETTLCKSIFMMNHCLSQEEYINGTTKQQDDIYRRCITQYEKTYHLNPTERLADINSFKILSRALKQAGNKYKRLSEYTHYLGFLNQSQEYTFSNCQIGITKQYWDELSKDPMFLDYFKLSKKQESEMQSICHSDDLELRTTYGLPLNDDEYLNIAAKRINFKL